MKPGKVPWNFGHSILFLHQAAKLEEDQEGCAALNPQGYSHYYSDH